MRSLLLEFLVATLAASAVAAPSNNDCFCYLSTSGPGLLKQTNQCASPPSAKDWEALGKQVTLVYPKPTAAPCFNNSTGVADAASINSDACQMVDAMWYNGTWRADLPGSMQTPTYEGSYDGKAVCTLNSTIGTKCAQGNINAVGVDARSVKDVQTALSFATKWKLRAIVRNTGHEELGRSTFSGAFMIWVHHMKGMQFTDNFKPSCSKDSQSTSNSKQSAVTIAGGVQWAELYKAASEKNVTVVGGLSKDGSVGAAGGWLFGGGHSGAMSGRYGLGVDNVLEFQVVLPSGKVVTANDCQNSDLFWALRGGGAGFGVVTSLTYKTHPEAPVPLGVWVGTAPSDTVLKQMLSDIIKTTPALSSEGWGDVELWDINAKTLTLQFKTPCTDPTLANRTLLPMFDRLGKYPNVTVVYQSFSILPSFYSFYENVYANGPAASIKDLGTYSVIGSHLMADTLYQNASSISTLVDAVMKAGKMGSTALIANLVAGGAVKKVSPDAMGLNPGWRKSYHHIITYDGWATNATAAQQQAVKQSVQDRVNTLSSTSPANGGYLNEASTIQPNWQTYFFGSHYDRLSQIKQKYDPDSRFFVFKGVGADLWDANAQCKLKSSN